MDDNLTAFIEEVTNEIERIGITAGNVAEIAEKHGLADPELMFRVPGFNKLWFLWSITQEAGTAFIKLINSREDFTANMCSPLLLLMCGGYVPTHMPFAKKVYDYKKDHILPVYFEMRRKS